MLVVVSTERARVVLVVGIRHVGEHVARRGRVLVGRRVLVRGHGQRVLHLHRADVADVSETEDVEGTRRVTLVVGFAAVVVGGVDDGAADEWYVRSSVAAVAAETPYPARDALQAIEVDYEILPGARITASITGR